MTYPWRPGSYTANDSAQRGRGDSSLHRKTNDHWNPLLSLMGQTKKKKRNRGHTRNQFPNPNPIVEVVGVKKLWKITRKRGHARRQFGICCESGLYLLFVELVASVARFYPFFRLPRASFTPANSKMDSNGHEFSTYNELLSPLPCFAESFDLKLPGTKGT